MHRNGDTGKVLTSASASCFSHRRDEDPVGCWPGEEKEKQSMKQLTMKESDSHFYFTVTLKNRGTFQLLNQ